MCILGEASVGKSSLIGNINGLEFNFNTFPTVG